MLTPIDFYYLVKELAKLIRYKLKNIYLSGNDYIFEFKHKEKIYLVVGKKYCYLTTKKFEIKNEDKFCRYLLKKLKNKKISGVWQEDFNKIVILKFDKFKLIFEFIGKGNIILCEDNKIIGALFEREFKDRKILIGNVYVAPRNEVSEDIKEKEKLLKLHIGKIYTNEIIKRNLSLGEILNEKLNPTIYLDKGKKVFISPFELKTLKFDKKSGKNFSEVIEELYREKENKEKIKNLQKENLKRYKTEEKEFREQAELLLEYKKEIERGIEEWKKKKKIIEPIRKINKNILIKIRDKEIKIKFDKDLQKEIEILFTKAKKARRKAKRIKEILGKNFGSQKEEKIKNKKKEWYEKFRYFFTSDGSLVIAGKDAETNEQIIKKYCKKDDFVLHAHIPGSPFGIIRSEGRKISKKTIEEAAQFVGCYSKFWTSKLGIADVYWIKRNQISKKVPGHQAIKKGSFMIYGKRNFLRVELKLAIGLDKNLNIVKGPESAVKKYAKYYVVIVPGKEEGKKLGKKIKERLKEKARKEDKEKIEKINIDEFLKVIPYGKGEVID